MSKQRAVLGAERYGTRQFRSLCVLRAWRDHVQRHAAQQLLSRTKGKCAAAALRHACGKLSMSLKSARARQLSKAMQAMWLHSTWQGLQLPADSFDALDQSAVSSLASMSREAVESLLATPVKHSGNLADSCGAQLSDEVLFDSPMRGLQSLGSKPGLSREMSPCLNLLQHRYFSPPSEDSTCVPSSSSQSRSGISAPSNPFAGARLGLVLEAVSLRRMFWAISQWHEHDSHLVAAQKSARMVKVSTFTSESHQLALGCQRSVVKSAQADAELATLRAECSVLQSQAVSVSGAEVAQQERLAAAEVQKELLEEGCARLEAQLSRHRSSESAALRHEQQSASQLRVQLERLQETHAEAEQSSEEALRCCSASQQRLASSERSCARLEAKIARKTRWRSEAEQHIREMVACGEGLEKERAQLRQKLSRSMNEHRGLSENVEALRCSLEQEEQIGEILKARGCALQEDNAALSRDLQHERQGHFEDVSRQREELKLARREELKASAALSAAEGESRSEVQAAEFAQAKLMAVWNKERDEWSLHSSRTTMELQKQVAGLSQELQAARQSEKAEFDAVAHARGATASTLSADFQGELVAMRKAVRKEFAGETELCRQMASQLEHRLAQAQELQEGMEEFAAAMPDPGMSRSPPRSSGIATPQLHELDAYAELVERLRVEVSREREERQAAGRSLETLRGSYRLLLQRVSAS